MRGALAERQAELQHSEAELNALRRAHARVEQDSALARSDLTAIQELLKAEGGRMSRALRAQLRTVGAGSREERLASLQVRLRCKPTKCALRCSAVWAPGEL